VPQVAIRWGALAPLVLTSLAIMGSPGPATMSLVAVGSAYGVRRCVPYLVGIIIGSTLVLLAVATGMTATLLAVPAVSSVVFGIAVAYILWLAYHIATAPSLKQQDARVAAPSLASGALLGLANPKAWIAMSAVFASADLAATAATDAAAKILVLTVMIIVINAAWLSASTTLAPLLRHPGKARVVNTLLAGALIIATALAVLE
jgi:threonine/homoserine/homoserine lactone efflux protein